MKNVDPTLNLLCMVYTWDIAILHCSRKYNGDAEGTQEEERELNA